ncbi:sigma-70 family RNA polymerase sigma factor [bacterium]|nr:MAG: sigma-70 family RNA polymerase sigma factor [bacterium]
MKRSEAAMDSEQVRFQTLLDSHKGIVFKVVGGFTWHADDQQDLAQEIRVQLWRAFPKFDGKRSFSTWMYQVALNTAISWSRQTKRRNARLAPDADLNEIPAGAPEEGSGQELYALIEGLDELSRALLLLYIDERSHAEIGEILGISTVNVATKISRIKTRLRLQVSEPS